eukprot:4766305-Pyramimonas_sp.AAC.1
MFHTAQALAAQVLKASKCHITPLAAAFAQDLAAKYAAAFASLALAWPPFVVASNLKSLGLR